MSDTFNDDSNTKTPEPSAKTRKVPVNAARDIRNLFGSPELRSGLLFGRRSARGSAILVQRQRVTHYDDAPVQIGRPSGERRSAAVTPQLHVLAQPALRRTAITSVQVRAGCC